MSKPLDFYTLNELFLNLGAIHSPAQLQGLVCGKLCGGVELSESQWCAELMEFLDIAHVTLDPEQKNQVVSMYTQTSRLLNDLNFGFSPLLPGDESSLERRTQELGMWCEGFLHGLGTSGLQGNAMLSPEIADALRDLAQISQVDINDGDDMEENEVYWSELVEYVKVSVLTVYTELTDTDSSRSAKNVVH